MCVRVCVCVVAPLRELKDSKDRRYKGRVRRRRSRRRRRKRRKNKKMDYHFSFCFSSPLFLSCFSLSLSLFVSFFWIVNWFTSIRWRVNPLQLKPMQSFLNRFIYIYMYIYMWLCACEKYHQCCGGRTWWKEKKYHFWDWSNQWRVWNRLGLISRNSASIPGTGG